MSENDQPASDFPNIGNPARRALIEAGYTQLNQLTAMSEDEIKRLHGVGPKAIGILRATLAEKGLAFAHENSPT